MAELRDNLLLDIDQALRQVRELENALNRALSEITVDVEVGPGVRRLEDDFEDVARAADEIADDTARIDRELKQADDSAEKLEREMRDVAKAADRAADETARIDREAKQAATSTGRLGGSLKALAVGAVAGIGLSQIADGLGAIIGAASETAESINAVKVVFGDAAQTILDFGEDTSDAVFLVASDFNQLATTLGNLLQGFGLDAQTAADITLELTERSADLASVFDTSVADALGAINSALQGQTESIRRFTGSFSIDEVKRFGRELFGVTGELTDQQQALAAVEFILQKTSKVQGDAANTADELANQQRALNEAWGNAQGALGDALIPLMEDFLAIMLDLVPAIEDAAPEFAEFVTGAVRGVSFLVNVTSAILNLGRGLTDLPRIITDDTRAFDQFGAAARATEGAIRDITNASDDTAISLAILGDAGEDLSFRIPGTELAAEFESAEEAAARLAVQFDEGVRNAAINAADAEDTFRDATRNAAFEMTQLPADELVDELDDVEQAFDDAARAANDFRDATLQIIDPIFAAVAAREDLEQAEADLADLRKDEDATLKDLVRAELDVARARAETTAAAKALGDINLADAPISQGLSIVGLLLGGVRSDAEEALLVLEVLEETDIGIEVVFEIEDSDLRNILSEIPSSIDILAAFRVPSIPTARFPDRPPDRLGATGASGTTVQIFNPTTNDLLGDAAQAANIISAVTGATGQFVGAG